MIYPQLISTVSPSEKLLKQPKQYDYGRADIGRVDRKYALILPCCQNAKNLRLSFNLSDISNDTNHGLVNVSALQIFMGKPFSPRTIIQVDLIVDVGGHEAKVTSQSNEDRDLWVHPMPANVDCLIAHFTPNSWMVLKQPIPTYRIDFCDLSPTCSPPRLSKQDPTNVAATLAHLAIF